MKRRARRRESFLPLVCVARVVVKSCQVQVEGVELKTKQKVHGSCVRSLSVARNAFAHFLPAMSSSMSLLRVLQSDFVTVLMQYLDASHTVAGGRAAAPQLTNVCDGSHDAAWLQPLQIRRAPSWRRAVSKGVGAYMWVREPF